MNPDFSRFAARLLNSSYFSYDRFTEADGIEALGKLDAERNSLLDALHDPKCEDYSSLSDEAMEIWDKAREATRYDGHCVPRPGETPEEYDLRDRMEGPPDFRLSGHENADENDISHGDADLDVHEGQ